MGGRYRLHVKVAPRFSADLVFRRQRLAIFVDGCFWHGCPRHGKSEFSGPNAELWESKIHQNRKRDAKVVQLLEAEGWHAMRVWECEIRDKPFGVAAEVMSLVKTLS